MCGPSLSHNQPFSFIFPSLPSSPSPLPGLRTVAGKEPWLIRARGLYASEGLDKCFRSGRGPPCLQLSRWLSESGPSVLCAPPHCLLPEAPPGLWAACAHSSVFECSPSLALSGFNPSFAWLHTTPPLREPEMADGSMVFETSSQVSAYAPIWKESH